MKDFIYALVHEELNTEIMFYIGRTIDPHRRLLEHRLGAKNYEHGDELKYRYANKLDEFGIAWDMRVLMECGPGTEFYEDYFVNLHRDQPLQNMKAGDSEPWMGRDYSSPAEFVKTRAKLIAAEEARRKASKTRNTAFKARPVYLGSDVEERTLFVGEKAHEKFVSPAVKAMLKKLGRTK